MLFANREMTPSSLIGFLHFQPIYLFLPTDHHFIERDLLLGRHKRKGWKRLIRNAMEHWVIKMKWKWKKSKLSVSCFEEIHLIPMPKKNTTNAIICPFITSGWCTGLKNDELKNNLQKCRCLTWKYLETLQDSLKNPSKYILWDTQTEEKCVYSSFHNRGNH